MSHNLDTHYHSGQPGTTGREPFEDTSSVGDPNRGPSTAAVGNFDRNEGQTGGFQSGYNDSQFQSGQSGQTGLAGSTGVSGSRQNYQGVAPGAAQAHGLEHGSHGHHGHSSGTGVTHGTAVGSAVGTGASQAIGGEGHSHSHHSGHHDRQHEHGSTKPSGEGFGGIGSSEHGSHVDRVGPQGQGSAAYERTGAGGAATSGAAGTDRFDSDRVHGSGHGTAENQDTSQRAPGKGLGGIGGVLGTSDKDFTGRDRTGGALGAYTDSDGPFDNNTSGPKGQSALTGREGNLNENPVAQAKSRAEGSSTTGSTNTRGEAEHKEGLLDKVKHAVGM